MATHISKIYQMIPPRDCTSQIGNLIVLLSAAQQRILESVSKLSLYELDYAMDDRTPTLGTLLKHISAVEHMIQLATFERRGFNSQEALFWAGVLPGPDKMLDRTINGNSADYYAKLWKNIRKKSFMELKKKKDSWLYIMNGNYNNFFAWYHLLEDHLCHFGQMKSIIKRIPSAKE